MNDDDRRNLEAFLARAQPNITRQNGGTFAGMFYEADDGQWCNITSKVVFGRTTAERPSGVVVSVPRFLAIDVNLSTTAIISLIRSAAENNHIDCEYLAPAGPRQIAFRDDMSRY